MLDTFTYVLKRNTILIQIDLDAKRKTHEYNVKFKTIVS